MAGEDEQLPQMTHLAAAVSGGVVHATFIHGRFDGHAVRELFELAMGLPESAPRLLVDCTGVDFVPSGGMGILVTIRKRFLSTGSQLHVVLPDPNVRGSFEVAQMGRLLKLFDAQDTARNAFR